jgi:hypothetical protein
MSLDMDRARKLCNAAEWRLVEASEPGALNTLTLAKGRKKVDQARKLRDTWCDMVARLGQPTTDAERFIPQKAELFTEVLRRFEEHLQKVESSASAASGGEAGRNRVSRSAARSKTAAAKLTGPPSTDEFIAHLRKLRFFEGYTASAEKLAEERIRTQHAEGLSGPLREYFERFPGFALVFISIDGEWDDDPCEPLVETVAQNSFGMFDPTNITDERDDEAGTATLSFTVNGQRYSRTITEETGGWVPVEFLELIEEAFAEHCGNLHFHETLLSAAPGGGDSSTWTICSNRAYKALEKAKLLPSEAAES